MDSRREYLLKKEKVCPLNKEELWELYNGFNLNYAHYTKCEIEFVDDDTRQEVVIKSNDEYIEDVDDDVFFFGLHYNTIVEFCKNGDIIENEWKIIKIGDVSNEI